MCVPIVFACDVPPDLRFARIVIFELEFVMLVDRVAVIVEFYVANPRIVGIAFGANKLFEFVVSVVVFAVNEKVYASGIGRRLIELHDIYFIHYANLRIPPPNDCTAMLPSSLHQLSSLFHT